MSFFPDNLLWARLCIGDDLVSMASVSLNAGVYVYRLQSESGKITCSIAWKIEHKVYVYMTQFTMFFWGTCTELFHIYNVNSTLNTTHFEFKFAPRCNVYDGRLFRSLVYMYKIELHRPDFTTEHVFNSLFGRNIDLPIADMICMNWVILFEWVKPV